MGNNAQSRTVKGAIKDDNGTTVYSYYMGRWYSGDSPFKAVIE